MLLSALLNTLSYDLHDTALQTFLLIAATVISAVLPKLMEHRDRREITYEKTLDGSTSRANDTYLLHVKIENTGNATIGTNDYIRPMEVNLKGRKVVSTSPPEVAEQTVTILDEDEQRSLFKIYPAIPQEDKIKLAPFHFQSGEALTMSIIVSGSTSQGDIELSARLNPAVKIVRAKRSFIKPRWLILPLLLILVTLIWISRFFSNVLLFLGVETVVTVILPVYTLLLIVGLLAIRKLKIVNL
jgi:hypothetical protein